MKILFVTYDFPFPINSGGKNRAYHLMKQASYDADIFLYSFTRNSYQNKHNLELEKIGVKKIFTHTRQNKKSFSALLKTLSSSSSIFKNLYFEKNVLNELIDIIKQEHIELVIYESFYTSFYIDEEIKKLNVKQIYGSENIEHILYHDLAKTKGKIVGSLYSSQVNRVRSEEENAYKNSDLIFAVTQEEKEYIQKKTKTPVSVIPNGINPDVFTFKKKGRVEKKLLFVGNFAYFPNIDAMNFFYKEVFLKIPDAILTVVGKHQEKLPYLISDTRVKNIDYVENIEEAYHNSDIFVFPVRFGGGTNYKVLEAASCGTAIVAIPDRVAGLGFSPDVHYISATSPTEFIDGINLLTQDKKLYDSIVKNARHVIENNFTWRKIGESFIKSLKNI